MTVDNSESPELRPLVGWSSRAPAPPAIEAGKARQRQEHAISLNSNTTIAAVGIDVSKNSFHAVGLDLRGAIVLRQKWCGSATAAQPA